MAGFLVIRVDSDDPRDRAHLGDWVELSQSRTQLGRGSAGEPYVLGSVVRHNHLCSVTLFDGHYLFADHEILGVYAEDPPPPLRQLQPGELVRLEPLLLRFCLGEPDGLPRRGEHSAAFLEVFRTQDTYPPLNETDEILHQALGNLHVVVPAPQRVSTVYLSRAGTVLGRHQEGAQFLSENHAVSRRHARISNDQGLWVIDDLRSRNGTFLNGRQIKAPTLLAEWDGIQITEFLLQFRCLKVPRRWLTSNVRDLARTIAEEDAFDRLPILRDALLDAGCDSDELLDFLARPPEPTLGRWLAETFSSMIRLEMSDPTNEPEA